MKPMPHMNTFARLCHDASERKGWMNLNRTDAQTINLMVSELSEALEDFRDKHPNTEIYYELPKNIPNKAPVEEIAAYIIKYKKPCGIPIELADTVIRIGQQCGTYNLDLSGAMDKTRNDVFTRLDLNEAMADATKHLSDAWEWSNQFYSGRTTGGGERQVLCFAKATWSILFFCEAANIDIWAAVEEKMNYNETREQLHGGKAI
jgi:hypothetical protein